MSRTTRTPAKPAAKQANGGSQYGAPAAKSPYGGQQDPSQDDVQQDQDQYGAQQDQDQDQDQYGAEDPSQQDQDPQDDGQQDQDQAGGEDTSDAGGEDTEITSQSGATGAAAKGKPKATKKSGMNGNKGEDEEEDDDEAKPKKSAVKKGSKPGPHKKMEHSASHMNALHWMAKTASQYLLLLHLLPHSLTHSRQRLHARARRVLHPPRHVRAGRAGQQPRHRARGACCGMMARRPASDHEHRLPSRLRRRMEYAASSHGVGAGLLDLDLGHAVPDVAVICDAYFPVGCCYCVVAVSGGGEGCEEEALGADCGVGQVGMKSESWVLC